MALDFAVAGLPSLALAVALFLLLAWVLYLDPRSPLHRALALFLFLRALRPLLTYSQRPDDPVPATLMVYVVLALPFALLHLAARYRDRYAFKVPGAARLHWPGRGWWILGAVLVVETIFLVNHELYRTEPSALRLLGESFTTFSVALAFLFGYDYIRSPEGPCRRALFLACAGFAFHPVFQATYWGLSDAVALAQGDRGLLERATGIFELLQVAAIGLLTAILLVRAHLRMDPDAARRLSVTLGLAAFLGVLRLAVDTLGLEPYTYLFLTRGLDALVALTMPLLIALSVARHHLLDVDARVRIGLQGSSLGALLIAAFYVFSEGVPFVVGVLLQRYDALRDWSTAIGILGTAILLVFLHPIYRLAERLSLRALPRARNPEEVAPADARSVYFDQAQLVWLDGVIRPKERLLLDRLRERLGLPLEDAAFLEGEAAKNPGRLALHQVAPTPPARTAMEPRTLPRKRRGRAKPL